MLLYTEIKNCDFFPTKQDFFLNPNPVNCEFLFALSNSPSKFFKHAPSSCDRH